MNSEQSQSRCLEIDKALREIMEACQATRAEAGVGHLRIGSFPAGMSVMIVKPDPVKWKASQQVTESIHAMLSIGFMSRTDSLPVVGRWRDGSVASDRRSVRMVLEIGSYVESVELGKQSNPLGLDILDLLCRDTTVMHEDGIAKFLDS